MRRLERRLEALERAADSRALDIAPRPALPARWWLVHGVDLRAISNQALDALERFVLSVDEDALPPAAMSAALRAIVRRHDGR